MNNKTKPISPADLADCTQVRRRVPVRQDVSSEEQAEREAFQHRFQAFKACANRIKELNSSERIQAIQAETKAFWARKWANDAPTRAHIRQVPKRLDVQQIVLMVKPPDSEAMTAVTSFLRWREGVSKKTNGRGVAGLLVLLSQAGGGKTSAGAWAVTWHKEDALYTTAVKIAANPLTSYSESHDTWASWLSPDLLVIDEVGREPTEKGSSILVTLYLERDALGRATILMGNRTEDEFMSRYVVGDSAIGSRLDQQISKGFDPIVSLAGDDLRLKSC